MDARPVLITAEGVLITGADAVFANRAAASSAGLQRSASPIPLKTTLCAGSGIAASRKSATITDMAKIRSSRNDAVGILPLPDETKSNRGIGGFVPRYGSVEMK